jgi:hypothetical protein
MNARPKMVRPLAVSHQPPKGFLMSMLSPQRLTMLIFFMQPIAFGSWLPRIPEVQQGLQLGPAALAFALLGLPCGTLLTFLLPDRWLGGSGHVGR